MNRVALSTTLSFVVLASLLGCTGSRPVTSPDIGDRTSQYFTTPVPLFGTGFHDIDLGAIVAGPGTAWYGIPVTVGVQTDVAVSINRMNSGIPPLFKPMYRWLATGGPSSNPQYIPLRENPNLNAYADYRFPKCAAAVFDCYSDPYNQFVEVAVCYQITGIEGSMNEWDVGLTIMRWHLEESSFPTGPPDVRFDIVLPDTASGLDELHPDVAYEPYTGDVYVVYEDVQSASPGTPVYLKYRRFDRNPDNHEQFTNYNPPTYPTEVDAQPQTHNGYTPCIDIGWVDYGQNAVEWVAIVYTSQYLVDGNEDMMNGYVVCCSAFQPVDPYTLSNFPLRNPAFYWNGAGLPSVDLSPRYDGQPHFGACAFVQEDGQDGYGPIVNVYEIDTFDFDRFTLISRDISNLNPNQNIADGLYPSIMVHYDPYDEFRLASITYMAQQPETQTLRPRVVRLSLAPEGYPNPWPPLANDFLDPDNLNLTISGNYNLSQIPFIEPGVSTAIALGTDIYWAAWCDRIEMEDPPLLVWGAYGNSVL